MDACCCHALRRLRSPPHKFLFRVREHRKMHAQYADTDRQVCPAFGGSISATQQLLQYYLVAPLCQHTSSTSVALGTYRPMRVRDPHAVGVPSVFVTAFQVFECTPSARKQHLSWGRNSRIRTGTPSRPGFARNTVQHALGEDALRAATHVRMPSGSLRASPFRGP